MTLGFRPSAGRIEQGNKHVFTSQAGQNGLVGAVNGKWIQFNVESNHF